MLMAVNEPYALMVQPDDILISPREVDEHFGTMVCFHPRYALGDHHNYMDKDDFLREMYLDTVGHDEAETVQNRPGDGNALEPCARVVHGLTVLGNVHQ